MARKSDPVRFQLREDGPTYEARQFRGRVTLDYVSRRPGGPNRQLAEGTVEPFALRRWWVRCDKPRRRELARETREALGL